MGNAIPVNATHTGRCTRALHLTMGKKAIKPRGALHMSETVSGRHHVAYPLRYTVPDMRHTKGTLCSWTPSQPWAVTHPPAFRDPDEEAAYIANTCRDPRGVAIRDGDGERGSSWSGMAVLLRSVQVCGMAVTRTLDEAGTPYVIVGDEPAVVLVPALNANRVVAAAVKGRTVCHLVPPERVKGSGRFRGTDQDERRLVYVAVTRSQKLLHMTWAPVPGNRRHRRSSSFWEFRLPPKYVKWIPVRYAKSKRLPSEPEVSVANVVLSSSELKYYFECPYQFKLPVLYGFNPPLDEALGLGQSLHDCLAEVHTRAIRGEKVAPSEAERLVQAHLRAPFAYDALKDKMRGAAERIVRDYIVDNAPLFDKVEFSEKAIELSLGDGISVVGRINLVRRTDTDETTIIDLKSNQRAQADDLTFAQLHIYALGYLEVTGKRADYMSTYHLEERQQVRRSVDDDIIEMVTGQVKTAAKALRKGELPPKPGKMTRKRCDYRRLCSCGGTA